MLIDENQLAKDRNISVSARASVSQNGRFLAFSTDTNGSERYTARIKDLETGELLPDTLTNLRAGLTWAADDTALAYGPRNRGMAHAGGQAPRDRHPGGSDVTPYKEEDQSFGVAQVFRRRKTG